MTAKPLFLGGGEGGTRTPDPAIMSRRYTIANAELFGKRRHIGGYIGQWVSLAVQNGEPQ